VCGCGSKDRREGVKLEGFKREKRGRVNREKGI
jgi:hypothetical protein